MIRSSLAALALFPVSMNPAFADPADDLARVVLAATPVIDGHNDTPDKLRDLFENDFSRFDLRALPPETLAKTHTDIARLRAGRVGGQFWSVWVDPELEQGEALARVLEQIDTVERMAAAYPKDFQLARTAAQVEAAMEKGKIASLIGMEGGAPIGESLGVLRTLKRAGVTYMTLTHFLTTGWADSATDAPQHDGLSAFGVSVVKEMNRIGMIVDLSHVSEAAMDDALDAARAPVIFSHSNARALLDHPRNVPDTVLRRLKVNGGVVMITFVPDYLSTEIRVWEVDKAAAKARADAANVGNPKGSEAALTAWVADHPRPRATIAQVADMIDHVRQTAGIDHIGIGSDFGGIDTVPSGLEDAGKIPALFAELARRGYSKTDLAKIAQGNVLRVMRAVEAAAR